LFGTVNHKIYSDAKKLAKEVISGEYDFEAEEKNLNDMIMDGLNRTQRY